MKSLYKIWIFVRDEFLLVRLLRWLLWRFKHKSILVDDYKSFLVLIKNSPTLDKSLTKEENYRCLRSQKNLEDYASIRLIWKDIYGLGIIIENGLANKDITLSNIRYLVNILYALLEFRGKWTNNHLIMNLLILRRYFLSINDQSEISRLDDLLVKHEKVIWQNDYFLEESSHYLFLIGLRTKLAGSIGLSTKYETAYSFYKYILPFYSKMTWIGDISPDKVNIPMREVSDVKLEKIVLDLGFMVCVLSSEYILKISISDSSKRHGHSDKGHLVFCSLKDEVCDRGIDDLANLALTRKEVHSNWNLGEFDDISKSYDRLTLNFKNAVISCYSSCVVIFFHTGIPKTPIITNIVKGRDLIMVYQAERQKYYSKVPLLELFDGENVTLCAE